MNEKIINTYKNRIEQITEGVKKACKENNIFMFLDLYGDINKISGCLIRESIIGYNEEINKLYEESLAIARKIYSIIVVLLHM